MVAVVLAAVGERLEQLVDRLEFQQLGGVAFLAKQARHRGAHHVVGLRFEQIDFGAQCEDRTRAFDLCQLRHGGLQLLCTQNRQLGQPHCFRGQARDVIQVQRLRRILGQIEDVIEPIDEAIHDRARERRKPRLAQQLAHFVDHPIGAFFDRLDVAHPAP